ncbi:hypothetical protein EV361DRAFT_954662 [Lentinula raphanica]|nr:hypothetical protein EV361DRAFT_954662 [Lentinula raphanica]
MHLSCFNVLFITLAFVSVFADAAAPRKHLDLVQRETLPHWILGEVDNPSFFTDKDRKAFSKTLWNVRLGEKLPVGGKHNYAIYSLKGYGIRFKSNSLIMKVFNAVNNAAIGEAKALGAVGDLVASGIVKSLGSKPAIIMKKKPGQPLHTTNEYKAARETVREKMRDQTYRLMRKEVVNVAAKKYVLHDDNHPALSNVLVTMSGNNVKSVALVDYGPPQTYFLDKSVTKGDVCNFYGDCEKPTTKQYLWEKEFPYVPPAPGTST